MVTGTGASANQPTGQSGWFMYWRVGANVSTPAAYKNVVPSAHAIPLREVLAKPVTEWKNLLVNDFESSVFKKQPIIRHVKEQLYESGAVYASMSGSGSAVFGIFSGPVNLSGKFSDYKTWQSGQAVT